MLDAITTDELKRRQPIGIFRQKRSAGVRVLSQSAATNDVLFSVDDATLNRFGRVARDLAAGFGLPGSRERVAFADHFGIARELSADDVRKLYPALRDYLFELFENLWAMQRGEDVKWPDNLIELK